MDEGRIVELLQELQAGEVSADDVVAELRRLPWADLGFARVDHHRALRQGLAEVVYGPGKEPSQVAAIVGELLDGGTGPVLVSRASDEQARVALGANPGGTAHGTAPQQTLVWRPAASRPERVVVACAGTADLPVADECAAVLTAHGIEPRRLTDVGVAGVHRLLAHGDELASADAVVVVAVPTSVGYGSSFEGVTALLAMLASCAAGVTVVGIDNGYGAACAVLRMLK